MKHIAILTFLAMMCAAGAVQAQWHIGFFSPFAVQTGVSIGYGKSMKSWTSRSDRPRAHAHHVEFLPQIQYAQQAGVSHSLMAEPALRYRWNRVDKSFYLATTLGVGYLLNIQQTGMTIDLASGEAATSFQEAHQLVPNLGLELGIQPTRHLGFYVRGNIGRSIGLGSSNALYTAALAGIIVAFKTTEK